MSQVNVQIDDETKKGANKVLSKLGITTTQAVNMLFKRIINTNSFPLELKIPNDDTLKAIAEVEKNEGDTFETVEEMIRKDFNKKF